MLKFWWIAILIVILDQATKLAAVKLFANPIAMTPFFNLVLVFNSGAAFGFLDGASGWQNMLFVVIAIVVSLFIIGMAFRLGANEVQVRVALMLILGGALGNLADRVRLGYVVDFLDLHYQTWHWPSFNMADTAISIGAVLLVLDAFGLGFPKRHN
ncbi:MAG: signal peptidase II [Gammaproteobacteria bacterium]|nr:MAG: signal peptidase II [Gammaproteobacteria bacterium]